MLFGFFEEIYEFRFLQGEKVLITGHTGFKGYWMCKALINAGANVTGYALKAPTNLSLFKMCDLASKMNSVEGDIRNLDHLVQIFKEVEPEIVIHMAAQPIVRDSYKNSFFTNEEYQKQYGINAPAVTTCRAGNVIGGGDFANDRIIPDCIRAVSAGQAITMWNQMTVTAGTQVSLYSYSATNGMQLSLARH